jgi:hypothetical protein
VSATNVSICTNALLMLGAQPISAMDEGTDRANLAASLYDSTRDMVLRSHPWNCAIKRVVLAPDVDTPAFDYDAQFTLPGDFLRVLQVGQDTQDVDWKVESGKLMASGTSLALRYVWKNTTESTWDAMLVHAMELQMAALMAYPITMSTSKQQLQEQKLADYMKRARAADGQDDPAQTLGDERLLNARFGAFVSAPGR